MHLQLILLLMLPSLVLQFLLVVVVAVVSVYAADVIVERVAALMSVERAAVAKCILFGLNDNYYRLAHCDREARPIPPTPVRGCLGLSV